MFSMFGRAGAPAKKGPHKRSWAENNHVITKHSVNFVALNSSYSTPSVLCAYNYVVRVLGQNVDDDNTATVRVV